jgi:hypothetical protein
VQVEIQGISKSLDKCHRATFMLFDIARFPAQESEYRLNKYAMDISHQL